MTIRFTKAQKNILCSLISNSGRMAGIKAVRIARPKAKALEILRYVNNEPALIEAYKNYKLSKLYKKPIYL